MLACKSGRVRHQLQASTAQPLAPRSKALVTYHTLQNRFDKLGYVLHGEGWSITPSHHQALPISGVRRQRRSTSTARTRRVSGIMAQCGNNSGIASQEQYIEQTQWTICLQSPSPSGRRAVVGPSRSWSDAPFTQVQKLVGFPRSMAGRHPACYHP